VPFYVKGCVRETRQAAHNWPSVVWVMGGFGWLAGMSLSYHALVTPCGGTLTSIASWSVFPRHIGAAGFRVKRVVSQEPVQLGGVVFGRKHGS
jgi:hypothetical protein